MCPSIDPLGMAGINFEFSSEAGDRTGVGWYGAASAWITTVPEIGCESFNLGHSECVAEAIDTSDKRVPRLITKTHCRDP